MATPYRQCTNMADRLSRELRILQSVRDDRDGLAFRNEVDDHNVLAIGHGSSNLHGSCADATRDLRDDLNFWHAIAFLLWWQNA
jgi:hypothetical protein